MDLIVLAMGPLVWPHAERSAWVSPILDGAEAAAARGATVIALSVGSCYPVLDWDLGEGDSAFVRDEELDLLRRVATVTRGRMTVRDRFMKQLAARVGVDAPLLPCVATYSTFEDEPLAGTEREQTFLINYMRAAGHHDYRNEVDAAFWRRQVVELIELERSSTNRETRFLCHAPIEQELATLIAPDLAIERVRGPEDLMRLARSTRVAVVNRVHAALGLAGGGVPSICVGTDTRALSASEVGAVVLPPSSASAKSLAEWAGQLSQADVHAAVRSKVREGIEAHKQFVEEAITGTSIASRPGSLIEEAAS
ncbi:hypothetical protein ACI2IX_17775 [Leifsonia aquatica]|uniref:hypothetical protein n=1 Tax=Leifsonia aquatica TaxID=144185 RepID=UPI00384DF528